MENLVAKAEVTARGVGGINRRTTMLRNAIPARPERDFAPLSYAQERLWIIEHLTPGTSAYNVVTAQRIRGRLNLQAFEQSFSEIMRRHEILRTRFEVRQGEPVQVIEGDPEASVTFIEVEQGREEQRERFANEFAAQEAERPFDLGRAPLIRCFLLRLSPENHVLLVVMHHIVSDGWSTGVIIREMGALYEAFLAGHPSPLPELPVQYADYACWQREWLEGGVLDEQFPYWEKQLGGELPILELPADRRRPPVMTFHGDGVGITWPPKLREGLLTIGRRESVTLFMTLLASFQALLHRYTGLEDVLVGTPVAGRNRVEIEDLIGFFVNTLVLRVRVCASDSFCELLRRARLTALEAHANQDVPFEKIVERLQPERDLSHNPLFQVMFTYQPVPSDTLRLPGLELSAFGERNKIARFDFTAFAFDKGDRFVIHGEYNSDLFERTTIERFLRHWRTLAEAIVAEPEQPIRELPLNSAEEIRQLTTEWNVTGQLDDGRECPHQWFEEWALRAPDNLAIAGHEGQLTYHELNARANRLAHYLQEIGVGFETRVGVCFERGIETAVCLLAILKAGGVYLPLDFRSPTERLDSMIEDSGAKVVITQGVPPTDFNGAAVNIRLDSAWDQIARRPESNPCSAAYAGSLAYLIYTSGSTGRPKGVLVQHGTMRNHLFAKIQDLQITASDVVGETAPVTFDISIWQFLAPLMEGGSIYVVPDAIATDGPRLLEEIDRSGVTIVETVPVMLGIMLEEAEQKGSRRPALKHLRWMISNADALPVAVCRQWFAFYPDIPLLNTYGITESSDDVTHHVLAGGWQERSSYAAIGRPVRNARIYVLDESGQPAPIGVAGEIHVGGDCLARGYLNRAELTAEKFVPDPFSLEAGSRMYRSGDRGRWLSNQVLEFLTRIDFQVKVRGHRIEPGEIEAALLSHADVAQAAVLAPMDEHGQRSLVAYVVAAGGRLISTEELRAFLRSKLPEHMMPGAILALESMPTTAHGKLDRKALPKPPRMDSLARTVAAPRSTAEKVLASIWEQTLRVEKPGIHDNFFEQGGHSITAMRVVSLVRGAFHVEIALRAIFEAPTIAELAACIEAARTNGARRETPLIARVNRQRPISLSYAQQRLWVIEQLAPGGAAYNVASTVRLQGPLNMGALERSFLELVRRHEILRTRFEVQEGEPRQVVVTDIPAHIRLLDLRCEPDHKREQRALEFTAEEAERPFDLSCAPLIRCTLLRLEDEDHVLLVTMHHMISDAWSTGIIIREVTGFYRAFLSGEPAQLPALPVQYADYSCWQREWLQGEVLEEQLRYWEQQLGGELPMMDIPADRPRPPMQTFHGSSLSAPLPRELRKALQTVSRQTGVTLFMSLLASFQALLHRYTGIDDVHVGTPIAGRNRPEIEGLVGFFLNTLVMRTDFSGNPTLRELLIRLRHIALEAYAHQDVPFEKIVERLQPERDLSHNPLFQVMFVYQDERDDRLELDYLKLGRFGGEATRAKFDLTAFVSDDGERFTLMAEYNTDLFDRTTVARLLGHWQNTIAALGGDLSRRTGDACLLTAEEHQQVVIGWNRTEKPFNREICLHQLFESQVDATPGAAAVICNHQILTYKQLDDRANRVAQHIKRLGVGRGQFVGVCMDRSADLIAALIGILKAGAAYVPLEPAYPAERITTILSTVESPCVFTDGRSRDLISAVSHHVPSLRHGVCMDAESLSGNSIRNCSLRWMPLDDSHTERIRRENDSEDIAYVIFTSGSTGAPKGVVVEHKAVVNLIEWVNTTFSIGAGDQVLLTASFCFDLSVYDVFGFLAAGASIRLATTQDMSEPVRLLEILETEPVTFWDSAPAALQQLTPLMKGVAPDTRLRLVFLSGDWIPVKLPDQVRAHFPGAKIIALGGATEAAVWSNNFPVGEVDPLWASIPYGKPIQNAGYYVLDSSLAPCPIGIPGDLYIGGECLALGYAHEPVLTASKFIPHPFAAQPGSRLYRTGDRARWRPDGNIEFLGRSDDQVKIRGFRIEIGEIQATLVKHPGVRENLVVALEEQRGNKRLVAYIVPRELGSTTPDELRRFLKQWLPDYMVPSAFVEIPAIPMTANGKVDRRSLPVPKPSAAGPGEAMAKPRSEVEQTLAGIWKEVLGIENAGLGENFFELGGDSILSVQVVARAGAAGLRLTARQVFENQTLGELAAVAAVMRSNMAEQGAVTGELPLTPVQRWFLDQDQPVFHHFNHAILVAAQQRLVPVLVRETIENLLRHHDALRLRFIREGGAWKQWNAPPGTVPGFELVDLSGLPAESWAAGMEEHCARAQARLDLQTTLVRVILFEFGAEHPQKLLFVVHHLAVDGVSWAILTEDFQTIYQQLESRRAVVLPPKTTSYKQWAEALEKHARSATVQSQLRYWVGEQSSTTAQLPLDSAAEANDECSAETVTVSLSEEQTTALAEHAPEKLRARFHELLLAALAQSISNWTGSRYSLIDVESHGRHEIDSDLDPSRTIGWFTNIYPVLLEIVPGDVVASVIAAKEKLRAIPGDGMGYGLLRYVLRAPELQQGADAQISFNYFGQLNQYIAPKGLFAPAENSVGPAVSPQFIRRYLLEVSAYVSDGRLWSHWRYSRNRHDAQTIERIAQEYVQNLRRAADYCLDARPVQYSPSDFPLAQLDDKALNKLLQRFGSKAPAGNNPL